MPKSVENEDGSHSDPKNKLDISTNNNNAKLYQWPRLVIPKSDPMKRKVRPLFSFLLLFLFFATLLSRFLFRQTLIASIELDGFISSPPQPLNQTLLKFAAIDLAEEKTKQELGQLLDGDFESLGRYKAFSTWRRFNHRDIRSKASSRVPQMLRSPNFYRHWLAFRRALQDWSRNRRFEPEIMSELVGLVKRIVDKSNGFSSSSSESNERYSSCAVVGNSGILLKSEFGEKIDNHEVVIRLNNARTTGFESRVGSKTSISFVNSNILHLCARREGCFCHPYGDNVPIVIYICQALHFFDYTVCNSSYNSPLIVTDPRFDILCSRVVKYYSLKIFTEKHGKALEDWASEHDGSFFHYSSGMQAVMLALGICEKVSLFGFGKSETAKHHYHTNQKAELHLHDYEAEYEFYGDLVKNPEVIPFIPRSFKIPPVVVYQ